MRSIPTLILCMGALCAYGGESDFPWSELKDLYRAQLTQELLASHEKPEIAPVAVIDSARYRLHIGVEQVDGEIEIAGRLVSGIPVPLPLFGPEVVLREGGEVVGASLLPAVEQGGIRLLPQTGTESFHVTATFIARTVEERGARSLNLAIPSALRSLVQLQLGDGLRLVEAPGIPGPEGEYYLGTSDALKLRYATASAEPERMVPEVDLFTRVVVSQRRVLLETQGIPVRALPEGTLFRLPAGAQLLNTTLKSSEFVPQDGGTFALSNGEEKPFPFEIESALTFPEDGSPLTFTLPAIDGNAGREGRFLVVEPDDGQVVVQSENLVTSIPVAQLGEGFSAGGSTHFMRVPSGQPITLTVTRFKAEKVMDTVLESQTLLVSFDETGRSLSTLRLELPADIGPRLVLEPVAGSEIWSLAVNGASKQVYTDAQGAWVVPLESGQVSVVELAFLREGEPVGLHGSLQVDVPRTGLGAKTLFIGVDLPDRVELQSVEGPVNTTPTSDGGLPAGLTDTPYLFTQPFYKGGAMQIAVSYKEPVNNTK